mgnify:FL=1
MNNKFNLKMQLVVRTALFNVMTERNIMPLDSHKIHNAIVDAMENYNKDQEANVYVSDFGKVEISGREIG